MVPITVQFAPTPEQWREAYRTARFDRRLSKLYCLFGFVLGLLAVGVALYPFVNRLDEDLIAESMLAMVLLLWLYSKVMQGVGIVRRKMRRDTTALNLAEPRTLVFTPSTISYSVADRACSLAYQTLRFSETKDLVVLYLTDRAFSRVPVKWRRLIPGLVLQTSRRIGVVPIPKRSFACIPDINAVREWLESAAERA